MTTLGTEIPLRPGWTAEISRKVLHLTSATTPVAYMFIQSKAVMLSLLGACTLVAVVTELARHQSTPFGQFFRRTVGFMVREQEWPRITGATYVMLGALLCVYLFPREIAIPALLVQSVSDSAASLVGLRYGRTRFLGKSLAGSLAFFFSALAILWLFRPEHRGAGFGAALVGTLAEAVPALRWRIFELNDNVLIPLLTAAALFVLEHHPPVQLAAALTRGFMGG
jgi:dolichol kinase